MSTYSDIILANPSLQHYYRLNDTTTTVVDAKGSSNLTASGTYTQSVTGAIANDSDKAFDTTGGSNGSAKTTGFTGLAGGDITLELWIKYTTTSSNIFAVGEGSGSSVYPVYYIGIYSGKLRIFVRTNTGSAGDVQTSGTYNDGNWHYVALVGDRTANTLYLYIDDVRSGYAASATYPTGTYGTNQFCIGSLYRTSSGNYAPAVYDEVALYNTPLSTDVMYHHYTAGKGQFGSFFVS